MLKPVSGNSPTSQTQSLSGATQALRKAASQADPQATSNSSGKAAAQDRADVSDAGKAAAAKAKSESQVEMAVREAARRPAGQSAAAAAGQLLRQQMQRASA